MNREVLKFHAASHLQRCRTVSLQQVVGVFPGARMDDGTEEELDIDVELLSWEDCCQHMVARVDKMWKQQSAQKCPLLGTAHRKSVANA